jgi:hypothetical protein
MPYCVLVERLDHDQLNRKIYSLLRKQTYFFILLLLPYWILLVSARYKLEYGLGISEEARQKMHQEVANSCI